MYYLSHDPCKNVFKKQDWKIFLINVLPHLSFHQNCCCPSKQKCQGWILLWYHREAHWEAVVEKEAISWFSVAYWLNFAQDVCRKSLQVVQLTQSYANPFFRVYNYQFMSMMHQKRNTSTKNKLANNFIILNHSKEIRKMHKTQKIQIVFVD